MSNKKEQIKWVREESQYGEPTYRLEREPGMEAHMLIDLVAKWGCVACIPDGEDSAGRQKMRLQTPEELVERSAEMVERTCAALDRRGWLIERPSAPAEAGKQTG